MKFSPNNVTYVDPREAFVQASSYDDVLLRPQYSDIRSRSEVDIGSNLDKDHGFALPIISSPMDTITETAMAVAMHKAGGLSIIHRYNTIAEQCRFAAEVSKLHGCDAAAAIGISGDYMDRATALIERGIRIICLDVAHGHHVLMRDALIVLRKEFGSEVHIMAGNVATLEAFNDLASWGADSIRIGIGGGSICSTRIQTGHGIPTLQSVLDCARSHHNVKIVADGGIKNSGDIVKALAAGADFVMIGSLLSGTDECPGEVIETTDGKFKTYRGMASKDAQLEWRGRTSSLEGVSAVVPCKGPAADVLSELERGIRSGFSYSGARTLEELQTKADFVTQTSAGGLESSTHILR